MVAPTINTVTPSEGQSRGETFVRIVGTNFNLVAQGTVRVTFGGIEASNVAVASATEIMCLSPRATALGAVNVQVTNITPDEPNPPIEESATLAGAFTYKRPSIATPGDFSNHPLIALAIRQLLVDLRLYVLANTHHAMHPEYASALDAAIPSEHQATVPSLKLMGPQVTEDAFYAWRGPIVDDLVTGTTPRRFSDYHEPTAVRLTFDLIGVAKTPEESSALWVAAMAYFKSTPDLRLTYQGQAVEIEMQTTWDQRGDFSAPAGREGIYQFTLQFQLRGLQVFYGKRSEGAEVLETPITAQPLE